MELSLAQRVGSLLYLVHPNTTTFTHLHLVPDYVHQAVPLFVFFISLEVAVRYLLGKPARMNQIFSSIGVGILHEATGFMASWIALIGYQWLYQYRLLDLPWASPYTWFGALVFVDFCYYWIHRANHELNILWAVHQVHHSSEDYNLATAVRLSVLQRAAHFGFYQPLALLGFPLPTVVVHVAFNYLFQFWVHLEYVGSLGPIGWVFMTPSYHRVHHGANKWCLDKNYASVFIIWDRIFGTFESERDNEEIVYGLTQQPQTHNVLWHEFYYFVEIYHKARSMTSWGDFLRALFYGPGWAPGTPRLGDPDTFTDVRAPRAKYDPQVPLWQFVYVTTHMILAFLLQQLMIMNYKTCSWEMILTCLIFIYATVGVTSAMYDGWLWAPVAEAARCAAVIAYSSTSPITALPNIDTALFVCFAASFLFWTSTGLSDISRNKTNKAK
ncbi:alkylglycerol monooxygenase [Procambarus clarkii]|uniref:alkylglycerol monooxygenase n=1 Tax=Procambarus clarkii TaxID=6728 RepID=UPI003742812F